MILNNLFFRKSFTLFIVFLVPFLRVVAQQPGGVNGTIAWFVSEKIRDGNKATMYLIDISGHSWKRLLPGVEDIKARNINFHPVIYLDGKDIKTDSPLKNFSLPQSTIIGLYYPEAIFSKNKYLYKVSDDYLDVGMKSVQIDTGKSNVPEIKYKTIFENASTSSTASYRDFRTAVYHRALKNKSGTIWGEDQELLLVSQFKGYLPELILYNRVLSPIELLKVQSYLSIKYGTTLDTSYVNSRGEKVWDINNPTIRAFHNRVIGIAKDSIAALVQLKSNTSYEPNPQYSSFEKNSYYAGLNAGNNDFIPAIDSPSLYRSETVGFSTPPSVSEGTYYMFGDNNSEVKPAEFTVIDSLKRIEVIKRIWLAHNPKLMEIPLKIILAGQAYNKKNLSKAITVFEKIYRPHDYQFYRYLLVKLKNSDIHEPSEYFINSYFGREQNSSLKNTISFNTRFLVWDSIFFNNPTGFNYYTFGRIPLLSFWEVGKFEKGKYDSIKLKYRYDRNVALTPETFFETTIRKFKDGDSIQFRLSLGTESPILRYKEVSSGSNWKPISDQSQVDTVAFETKENSVTQESSISSDSSIVVGDDENEEAGNVIGTNIKYIDRQNWKSRKNLPSKMYKIRGLSTDKTYIIEATDAFGQKSELRLTLKSGQ